jgi:hypothetical protein
VSLEQLMTLRIREQTWGAQFAGLWNPAHFAHYIGRPVRRLTPLFVGTAVAAALLVGWFRHDEEYLVPTSGLGYWLGIIGAAMMLLLSIYSFRKRFRALRIVGSIPTWFRIHMLLGTLGPVLIIFHANFRLGALNSNVALFTMLTVAASGVIGRYIYGKIHMGLYGRKALAREILADAQSLKQDFGAEFDNGDFIFRTLDKFGAAVLKNPPTTALQSLAAGGLLVIKSHFVLARLRREARRVIEREAAVQGWTWRESRRRFVRVNEVMTLYLQVILKAAALRFYERLFSLWHVLHLPLFFLMVLATLVHIYATHQY